LIANTATDVSLRIQAALDTKEYPIGIKVSNQRMREI
jgi:hypothetical protein